MDRFGGPLVAGGASRHLVPPKVENHPTIGALTILPARIAYSVLALVPVQGLGWPLPLGVVAALQLGRLSSGWRALQLAACTWG